MKESELPIITTDELKAEVDRIAKDVPRPKLSKWHQKRLQQLVKEKASGVWVGMAEKARQKKDAELKEAMRLRRKK